MFSNILYYFYYTNHRRCQVNVKLMPTAADAVGSTRVQTASVKELRTLHSECGQSVEILQAIREDKTGY